MLCPLLFALYTHDCTPTHSTNTIVKFVDDTTVVGLIKNGDESGYRDEVCRLTEWCTTNNLTLSTTKEMIISFRKQEEHPAPLYIRGDVVERVPFFKFLGTYSTQDLTWTHHTTELVKKQQQLQQQLYFLRTLKRSKLSQDLLVSFYCCCIESTLIYDMLVWFSSCTAADKKSL